MRHLTADSCAVDPDVTTKSNMYLPSLSTRFFPLIQNVYHQTTYSQFRRIHLTLVNNKLIPSNLKGKSSSSIKWLTRQLNDPFVKRARYERYRARSAFKLIEIDDKYKILKSGMIVVECGAAPGAWTQVLTKRLGLSDGEKELDVEKGNSKSLVISIDRNPFQSVPGAITIPNTDFTSPLAQSKILSALDGRKVDLVCSDMAPNATGIKSLDHESIIQLSLTALQFALQVLQLNGTFLTKTWDGKEQKQLIEFLEKFFHQVNLFKPVSSREDSSEIYILARRFKGTLEIKE